MFRLRKATMTDLVFLSTSRAVRCSEEQKMEKETDEKGQALGMDSKKIEGDKENGEVS